MSRLLNILLEMFILTPIYCKLCPILICMFLKNEDIPDFHMVAVKLKHERTGAEHLHIARDDQNNVFR